MNYIAGFAAVNDYSERSWQLESPGQWTKGKSADSFCPLGPWLVTAAAVGNAQNLNIWLTVNGVKMQESNTSDMVFKIPFLGGAWPGWRSPGSIGSCSAARAITKERL